MTPTIIIPAYQPTEILLNLIKDLHHFGVQNIIVVNDGSHGVSADLLPQIENLNIVLLHHQKNKGKGAALKTAFKYWLDSELSNESPGVITADADGQHCVEDILKLSKQLIDFPQQLHIGCREFSETQVPWRSRFGNNLTKWIFNKLLNINLNDTQSGLRAIPQNLINLMLDIKSERYEFELEMLLIAKKNQIEISATPIKTIYINQNRASHFNPFIDSAKIYFVFVRFAFISMMSGLIDMMIFFITFFISKQILLAIGLGRLLSGIFNFNLNKRFAFKNAGNITPIFVKYVAFAGFLALSSYTLIKILYSSGCSIYFSKISAEITLYVVSFLGQRKLVFTKSI